MLDYDDSTRTNLLSMGVKSKTSPLKGWLQNSRPNHKLKPLEDMKRSNGQDLYKEDKNKNRQRMVYERFEFGILTTE